MSDRLDYAIEELRRAELQLDFVKTGYGLSPEVRRDAEAAVRSAKALVAKEKDRLTAASEWPPKDLVELAQRTVEFWVSDESRGITSVAPGVKESIIASAAVLVCAALRDGGAS